MAIPNLAAASDDQLVAAIRVDDRQALGELYNRYYKKVFHKCFSFTRKEEEAFDLAQESLMKAFDNIHSFKGEASFSTWLYTITHRHCLASLKKKGKFQFQTLEDNFSGEEETEMASPVFEDDQVRTEQEMIMYALINALPSKEKDLLILKYLQGESIETLQEQYQISSSAVKMRLKRSREKLNALYALALTYGLDQVLAQVELFTAS
ncbi:MAG: RNA polymerase sigma factor [Bacteroidetes bacterium]|nr:RNA polymerase sigma factor [Bacteroidota bacterium]MBS1977464.1 RNA polymerase sigma factor [Bacteroidota bacterium]